MQNQAKTTIDPEEIARFSAIADEWWDPKGKFAPLHRINPLRIEYIVGRVVGNRLSGEEINISLTPQPSTLNPLKDLSLLDIGCGGGLIAEPMARLGANVTAIDASEKNIAVAKLHAQTQGLSIDYRCATAEALAYPESQIPNPESFDIVLALEIIEHVANIPIFVEACAKLVKPGGLLIMSTINRTAKSYALAIVGAEYILRWLPIGTHTWSKFVRPHELVRVLEKNGVVLSDMQGMVMNPLTFKWRWDAKDVSVNYIITGRK